MAKAGFNPQIKIGAGRDSRGRFTNVINLWLKLENGLKVKKFQNLLLGFFNQQGLKAAGFIVKNSLSGQLLKRRTGALARSMTGKGVLVKGVPAVKVGIFRGPALEYAGAHEFGATITPKKAKALAIPQPHVQTPAGVDRFGGPRGYPGELKFIPFRSSGVAVGGLFDAESLKNAEDTEGGLDLSQGIMAYLLVRQVKIPAKHYLRDGFRKYLPQLARELADFLKDAIVKGGVA